MPIRRKVVSQQQPTSLTANLTDAENLFLRELTSFQKAAIEKSTGGKVKCDATRADVCRNRREKAKRAKWDRDYDKRIHNYDGQVQDWHWHTVDFDVVLPHGIEGEDLRRINGLRMALASHFASLPASMPCLIQGLTLKYIDQASMVRHGPFGGPFFCGRKSDRDILVFSKQIGFIVPVVIKRADMAHRGYKFKNGADV